MKFVNVLLGFAFLALIFLVGFYFGKAPEGSSGDQFSVKQKEEIEAIVRKQFSEHPEILYEAAKTLQQKESKKQQEKALAAVAENIKGLLDASSPELGNPKGSIILVEFLDYQCPHCKKMEKPLQDVIKENPDLRVILKPLPIFGKDSEFAAKAVLASAGQNKFNDMHGALLNEQQKLSEDVVISLAKTKGLNVEKLKSDIANPKTALELDNVKTLAGKIGITGTPFLILMKHPTTGDKTVFVLPGAVPQNTLQQYIDKLKQNITPSGGR